MLKKILVVLLTIALCLPMMFSVSAAIPEIAEADKTDITVLLRHDFDDVTEINTSASPSNVNAANGFVALDGLDCSLQDGALLIDHDTKTSAFFDLQLWNINDFPILNRDVIVSMKIKPLAQEFSSAELLNWGTNGGSHETNRVAIVNSNLVVDNLTVGTLAVNEYSLVEWAFHYDSASSKFSTVDVLLNGTKVGEYSCNGTISKLNHLRVLRFSAGSCMVDDVTLAFGTTSILYAKNAEVTFSPDDYQPEIGECKIPVIPEESKIWMDVVIDIDFNAMDQPTQDNMKFNQGFVPLDGFDCSIVNGELLCKSTNYDSFFDLQFYELGDDFPKIKEDVILSLKVKPLSANFSAGHLMDYKFNTAQKFEEGKSSISACNLNVAGKSVGELPYGVYSLIEFAFHYDTENSEYDRVDIESTVVRVNHFRMFRYINGQFALDDIILARGNTSLVYYSPTAEKPAENTGNNGSGSTGTTTNETPTTEKTPTTEAPTTEAPVTTAPQTSAPPKKTGCASSVAVSVGVCVLTCALGVALLKKREEFK